MRMKTPPLRRVLAGAAVMLALNAAAPARARDLTIGVTSAVTALDPHYHNLSSNFNVALNIFDRLIDQDAQQRLVPGLASAWTAIDDTTWEFTLRPGISFHDGSPFGAEDVAASLRRVPAVPNSPGSYEVYTRAITEIIVVDPLTLRLKTAQPAPLLPVDLSSVDIISRAHEKASTADFNSGVATIGTGPYRFVAYAAGDRLQLRRNDAYWGRAPAWENATIRIIPGSGVRIAALLSGDVQAIDNVPPTDARHLAANSAVRVESTRSNSVLFLHMDQFRDQTPMVTDRAGQPLPQNPFKDIRVRRALSLAIDRRTLTERLMEGAAAPASQLLADGFFGVSPRLQPDRHDPEAAKKLLAEAGYPNGFSLTIAGSNNRYLNDAKVVQAIAPMLIRVGIEAKVATFPWSVFITQAGAPHYAYSLFLAGNSATTGEASFPLRAQFATVNRETGMGSSNRARYSNPEVDRVLAEAMRTVDDRQREALLQKVAEIAMADQAVIPLFYQNNVFATRVGYRYTPRSDGFLSAAMVTPE
ncbi:ABC transporter substrate-binding protein [Roseomonas sp. 18066]|uniref:ABC transporter substrate-binding protein n=1 Tax=Roseomonas sp. 18066 TaxID=2681412 RepID=UPI001F19E69C|nr:ABC transporter substrate-binding protein [Roseomonas sp. 18066]